MSKVAELAYDIEQLYIEGHNPKAIAVILECPVEVVYDWLEDNSISDELDEVPQDEEIYSPYYGA